MSPARFSVSQVVLVNLLFLLFIVIGVVVAKPALENTPLLWATSYRLVTGTIALIETRPSPSFVKGWRLSLLKRPLNSPARPRPSPGGLTSTRANCS